MKNAGKACNNRLYRHIRTFEKIVKNYFVIYYKYMRSNGVTIDFNQWMEHESSPLLAVLEYIQPVKDTDN